MALAACHTARCLLFNLTYSVPSLWLGPPATTST
jgi:hypothetical protein